jgi:hypothetical protein
MNEMHLPLDGDPVAAVRQLVVARIGRHFDGLNVECTGNQVVVSGRSPSYFWKQVAIEAALDVARKLGNILLRFEITVVNPSSNHPRIWKIES